MHIRTSALSTDAGPRPSAAVSDAESEVARLRAQVAMLQAERAALWWAVGHDDLTGLPNRRLFYTLAPRLLREGSRTTVIVLDLNGFKPINDTCGHSTGDEVLRTVAKRLSSSTDGNLVARLGGDEFAAVLRDPSPRGEDGQWWQPVLAALSKAIAQPMSIDGRTLTVTASIGIASGDPALPVDELLQRADQAMYHAKTTGLPHSFWGSDGAADPEPDEFGWSTARSIELALYPAPPKHGVLAFAPTCDPIRRNPSDVAPASVYRRHDPVWVFRGGAWRPGIVEGASANAVMATYRYTDGPGTIVDTMSAQYVVGRDAADPQLDRRAA
jgi:diguanylate cyclase (GGDEF)-like protein